MQNEHGNDIFRQEEADKLLGFRGCDRYRYDTTLCQAGWRQFDTNNDAWYFGVWVNIEQRKTFCYVEGDRVLVVCPTLESFQAELAEMGTFYGEPPPAFTAIDADGSMTHYYDERPAA